MFQLQTLSFFVFCLCVVTNDVSKMADLWMISDRKCCFAYGLSCHSVFRYVECMFI